MADVLLKQGKKEIDIIREILTNITMFEKKYYLSVSFGSGPSVNVRLYEKNSKNNFCSGHSLGNIECVPMWNRLSISGPKGYRMFKVTSKNIKNLSKTMKRYGF